MTTVTHNPVKPPAESNGTSQDTGPTKPELNGHTNGATTNGIVKGTNSPRTRKQTPANKAQTKKSAANKRATVWRIVWIPIQEIGRNPFQPREAFDPAEMENLVASIREHGILQPVTVRTTKLAQKAAREAQRAAKAKTDDKADKKKAISGKAIAKAEIDLGVTHYGDLTYHLVTGERRLRACNEARFKEIPAIIRDDLSDTAAAELALVENLQRSNLNVIEEAAGYKRLMVEFRMKEERIAKKVGRSVQTIKDTIKLLSLPAEVRGLLARKLLTPSHGQYLLRLAGFETLCTLVAQRIVHDKLTALSLQSNLLPNARELKGKKLLVELDHHTQFEWREECAKCPFHAYLHTGYSSYCLQPLEWQKKQDVAVALKKEEAARVLEEAKQAGRQTVDVEKLPSGSYRNLSWSTPPSGCNGQCPCRSEFQDPDNPTVKIPLCLDPQRYNGLVETEREAQVAARRRQCLVLWEEAKAILLQESKDGDLSKPALLLARRLLTGRSRYVYNLHHQDRDAWQAMLEQVGEEVGVTLPWPEILAAAEEKADAEEYEDDAFEESEDATASEAADGEAADGEAADGNATDQKPGAKTPSDELELLRTVEPERLLMFTAAVLVVVELQDTVRFGGETPELDLVLGRCAATQMELSDESPQQSQSSAATTKNGSAESATTEAAPAEHDEDSTAQDSSSEDATIQEVVIEEEEPAPAGV